jgi:hypothetical protein
VKLGYVMQNEAGGDEQFVESLKIGDVCLAYDDVGFSKDLLRTFQDARFRSLHVKLDEMGRRQA